MPDSRCSRVLKNGIGARSTHLGVVQVWTARWYSQAQDAPHAELAHEEAPVVRPWSAYVWIKARIPGAAPALLGKLNEQKRRRWILPGTLAPGLRSSRIKIVSLSLSLSLPPSPFHTVQTLSHPLSLPYLPFFLFPAWQVTVASPRLRKWCGTWPRRQLGNSNKMLRATGSWHFARNLSYQAEPGVSRLSSNLASSWQAPILQRHVLNTLRPVASSWHPTQKVNEGFSARPNLS